MNIIDAMLDISWWRGARKTLGYHCEGGSQKVAFKQKLGLLPLIPLLHETMALLLATLGMSMASWSQPTLPSSVRAYPMTVLTPWTALLARQRLSGPLTLPMAPTCPQTTMEETGGCSPILPLFVNKTTTSSSNHLIPAQKYVYPQWVLPLMQQLRGDEQGGCYFL